MTNIESLKRLWERTSDPNQLDKIADVITTSNDLEAMKWLWGKTSVASRLDKIVDAITTSNDLEAMKWLWGKTSVASRLDRVTESIASSGNAEAIEWILSRTSSQSRKNRLTEALLSDYIENNISSSSTIYLDKNEEPVQVKEIFKYDLFISHASEDKDVFVRPLVDKLKNMGLRVWYDEFTLLLGDSLRRSIDHGLANSRYGVVVLSEHFFKKEWPQKELDGLVAREEGRDKVILPVWHGVTKAQVKSFSPILSGRVAVSSNRGLEFVAEEIMRVLEK